MSVGELVGVGLTAVAARRHGERDPAAAARATGSALVLAIALGALVGVGGVAGLPAVLRLMEARGEVAVLARDFLVVQLLGAFLIYGYFVVTAAFRSAGDTRTPFVLLGGSVLLNLVLDPLMILGWGPIPALGVYGRRWRRYSPGGSASSSDWSCCAGAGGSASDSSPAWRERSSGSDCRRC